MLIKKKKNILSTLLFYCQQLYVTESGLKMIKFWTNYFKTGSSNDITQYNQPFSIFIYKKSKTRNQIFKGKENSLKLYKDLFDKPFI